MKRQEVLFPETDKAVRELGRSAQRRAPAEDVLELLLPTSLLRRMRYIGGQCGHNPLEDIRPETIRALDRFMARWVRKALGQRRDALLDAINLGLAPEADKIILRLLQDEDPASPISDENLAWKLKGGWPQLFDKCLNTIKVRVTEVRHRYGIAGYRERLQAWRDQQANIAG
jgi:hypothetical protein